MNMVSHLSDGMELGDFSCGDVFRIDGDCYVKTNSVSEDDACVGVVRLVDGFYKEFGHKVVAYAVRHEFRILS